MRLQTPFFNKHLERRAQWMEAPGFVWQLPAVYGSLEQESQMVRERVGFIDYGHQFTLSVAGRDALCLLQKVLVNDLGKISPGKAIYSTLVNEAGTIIDDVICFWLELNYFIVSGIRKQQVVDWLKRHSEGMDVYLVDAGYAMLAIQGPYSREILQKAVDLGELVYFSHKEVRINDIPALIVEADSLWDKVNKIAKKVYRAAEVTADAKVRNQIKKLQDDGYGHYPVCVAKTQYSFSTDAQLRGAPENHVINIREVRLATGAEFVVMVCGDIMTMPGLPKVPSANKIDLVDGKVVGLF